MIIIPEEKDSSIAAEGKDTLFHNNKSTLIKIETHVIKNAMFIGLLLFTSNINVTDTMSISFNSSGLQNHCSFY